MGRAEFGRRIRELRLERGIGLRELARRAGIEPTRLSRIERGLRPPPEPAALVSLAQALEVEPPMLARLAGLPQELLAEIAEQRRELTNLLKGRIVGSAGGLVQVKVGEALVEAVADTEDGEVEVEIRPEEITLHLGEGPQSSARNRLPGTVKEILPYENYHHVIIDCRDFPLKVAVTAQSIEQLGLRPGVEVFTFFKATAVKVLQPNQLGGDAHAR